MNAAKRVQINVALQSVDTLQWVSNKVFECEFIWISSFVDTSTSGKTRNQRSAFTACLRSHFCSSLYIFLRTQAFPVERKIAGKLKLAVITLRSGCLKQAESSYAIHVSFIPTPRPEVPDICGKLIFYLASKRKQQALRTYHFCFITTAKPPANFKTLSFLLCLLLRYIWILRLF